MALPLCNFIGWEYLSGHWPGAGWDSPRLRGSWKIDLSEHVTQTSTFTSTMLANVLLTLAYLDLRLMGSGLPLDEESLIKTLLLTLRWVLKDKLDDVI